ncbi:MAG: hypothetical protein ACFB6R_15765 [Alphaproteobacteria bacterium]
MHGLQDLHGAPSRGRFWPIDQDGCIQNDASAELIDPLFCHAIAQAVDAYRRNLKDDLHSIYVTGSVARGRAVAGLSNLDMAAILNPGVTPGPEHQGWLDIGGCAAGAGQAAAREITLSLYAWTDVFPGTQRFSRPAFILGTGAVCVCGPDVEPRTPRLPLCAAIANDDVIAIEDTLSEAREALTADPSAAPTRAQCRHVMRAILHAAFALVMLEESEHTRDLDLACDLFLLHHPEHRGDLSRAFHLAMEPSGDAETVLALVDRVRGWLLPKVNHWLDRYNPERQAALPVPA